MYKDLKNFWWLILIVLILGVSFVVFKLPTKPGKFDSFAQCLSDKDAIFYGAFWCPHCQNQKASFGKSSKLLKYVECSTPDGKGQLPVCKDKKIQSYPTWEFSDGSRMTGEVPLLDLAQKTGCVLSDEQKNI